MNDFDRPGTLLEGPVKRRQGGSRFGQLGDRLAKTFGSYETAAAGRQDWDGSEEYEYADGGETMAWETIRPRFPIARHGYDRAAVDDHIAELERELADLQTRSSVSKEVSTEIERIGEQTSAILTVAHDQAQEMKHKAQEQADRCLADAASNAVMITEDAKRRLRQLDSDTDAVWRERARLVEDVRNVATALISIAEDAADRFPPEPDRPAQPESVPFDHVSAAAMTSARVTAEPASTPTQTAGAVFTEASSSSPSAEQAPSEHAPSGPTGDQSHDERD